MPSPCPAFAPWSGRAFFHGRARVDTNSRSRPVATTRCVCGTWFRNDPRRIGDRWVFGQGSWGRAPARSLPNGDRPIKAVLGLSSVVSRETTQRSFPSAKGGSWGHVSRGTCASSLWSEFDSLAQSGTQGTAPKGANCPNQDCTPPQDVRCAMRAGGPDDTPRGSQNADDAVFPEAIPSARFLPTPVFVGFYRESGFSARRSTRRERAIPVGHMDSDASSASADHLRCSASPTGDASMIAVG